MYRVKGTLAICLLCFSGSHSSGISFFARNLLPDIIVVSIMAIMVQGFSLKGNPVTSLSDIASPVVGLMYISGLLSFQAQLREIGPEWIIFLYATVWASDSMAYYIGKGIGERRLYKEVSPNKTVAGAAGSVLGGALGALLLSAVFVPYIRISSAIFIGIMIGIISIIGDLVESMFKRDAGVKDSGV